MDAFIGECLLVVSALCKTWRSEADRKVQHGCLRSLTVHVALWDPVTHPHSLNRTVLSIERLSRGNYTPDPSELDRLVGLDPG